MNSFIGLLVGTCIAFCINMVRSSREYHDSERQPSIKDSSDVNFVTFESASKRIQQNKDAKIIYASRLPINRLRKVGIITICFVTMTVGLAFIMEGFDDLGFLIAVGVGALLMSSPILAGSAYSASVAKDAINSKRAYLEIHDDGIICHSRLCGPVLEILWTDIINFTPILPALGTSCSIQIEHRVRGETKIVESRYFVNVIDINLAQFVSLLEFHTGLETQLPATNLYHA